MSLLVYPTPIAPAAPIGVFDSGVGGLSVLRHIHGCLPQERLVYVADSAYAPYGSRSEAEIAERALAIGALLVQDGIKALVVACNTATAVAIAALRQRYPALVVVGVEPGLKPAAAATRTGIVGVLATQATLASGRFALLRDEIAASSGVRFLAQGCSGLVDCIEQGDLDSPALHVLLQRYVLPLLQQQADTLVLGCTHYPFVAPAINAIAQANGHDVTCIDTGEAVARQLARVLAGRGLLYNVPVENGARDPAANVTRVPLITGITSGPPSSLVSAFERLLQLQVEVSQLEAPNRPAHGLPALLPGRM